MLKKFTVSVTLSRHNRILVLFLCSKNTLLRELIYDRMIEDMKGYYGHSKISMCLSMFPTSHDSLNCYRDRPNNLHDSLNYSIPYRGSLLEIPVSSWLKLVKINLSSFFVT